jgi:catechol 1,2-dioxygenase
MLATLGRHTYRPAHLHFIVEKPGFERVVTHIFTPDCPYLKEDAVFGVKRSLVADFRRVEDQERAAQLRLNTPFWEVEWNFVLTPTQPVAAPASGT